MSALAPLRSRAAPVSRPTPAKAPARSRPAAAAPRPSLRVVEAPATTTGRIAFVVLVGAILGGGLVVLLLLHTLAAQDAFTLHRLQRQAATLGDTEQQLTVANQQASAPTELARRARALGMVPTGEMTIVRRRDGRIVGVATAAYVPAPPAAKPAPNATPTAAATPTPTKPTAAGSKKPAAPKRSAAKSAKRRPH